MLTLQQKKSKLWGSKAAETSQQVRLDLETVNKHVLPLNTTSVCCTTADCDAQLLLAIHSWCCLSLQCHTSKLQMCSGMPVAHDQRRTVDLMSLQLNCSAWFCCISESVSICRLMLLLLLEPIAGTQQPSAMRMMQRSLHVSWYVGNVALKILPSFLIVLQQLPYDHFCDQRSKITSKADVKSKCQSWK